MVVQVVNEADSNDPGVICGVSPTDKEGDFLAFFSKYFFDSVLQNQLASPASAILQVTLISEHILVQ
jgi:hypothetical protein